MDRQVWSVVPPFLRRCAENGDATYHVKQPVLTLGAEALEYFGFVRIGVGPLILKINDKWLDNRGNWLDDKGSLVGQGNAAAKVAVLDA